MNYRYSKQRTEVLDILDKKNYHPTVDELYSIVKKKYPKVSLATIYRNVEQLTKMEKIVKIEIPNEPARYDGNIEKHYHVRCEKCGKINDVWLEGDLEKTIKYKHLEPDFTITGYKIEFIGICKECSYSEKN